VTDYLLDVNVLIALLSPKHEHRSRAQAWFEVEGHRAWLTCPTTQNGVIRIMSGRGFSRSDVTPGSMIESLHSLCQVGHHRFVPDDVSLLDDSLIFPSRLLGSRQVTDTYLLALAVWNDALLATMDEHLAANAIRNGADHLRVI
jgi:uncharacterized protein